MAAAIIPAAGRSARMGRPKPLMPFGSSTILGCLVGSLRAAEVGRVVVVRSPDSSVLQQWCAGQRIESVVNPEPERGMLSSIQVGVARIAGGGPLLVCPADHPAVRPETIRTLLAAVSDRDSLAVPVFDGRRGHPLAIGAGLVAAIGELDPAIGLRQLLEQRGEFVNEIAVEDEGVILDLDTPEDYERARSFQRRLERWGQADD